MKSKTDAFLDEVNKSLSEDTNKTKAKKKSKTVRGCIFEVCQDLDAFDTVPDFDKCAESTGADKYMWKIHDSDAYDEDDLKVLKEKGLDMTKYCLGAPKNDHVHIYLRFKSPTTLPKIAKIFGVPEQNVQKWTGAHAWENAISYLTHRTPGAKHKYQYDPSTVHANFDYVQALADITKSIAANNAKLSKSAAKRKLEEFADLYKVGQISFAEFKRRVASDPTLLGLAAKKKRELDAMHELVDGQEAQKFFDTFKQPQRVIWLYGDTGCGKTLAATYMAENFAKKRFPDEPPLDNSYQVLGSSRGTFERYLASVHCIVLDDFRPNKSFSFDDLLRNFNPYHKGPTSLPGRYHDRQLAAGIIIITSKYNPAEFSYRFQDVWVAVQNALDEQQERHLPRDYGEHRNTYKWSLGQIEEYYKSYPWNTCDKPDQIMRRSTVYKVSRGADDAVLFQWMRPIYHDDGYCEYVEDASDPHRSLEEVWECKNLDFNPFNLSSYNYYSRNFDLDYHDQTLSEEDDFMLRCRKTYLYIHGGEKSHYLDEYNDPEIEVKKTYDQQAFEAIKKKVEEDGNHEFDALLDKIKNQLDAMQS